MAHNSLQTYIFSHKNNTTWAGWQKEEGEVLRPDPSQRYQVQSMACNHWLTCEEHDFQTSCNITKGSH